MSAADAKPAVLLTGAGKRYDIVSCFAALTTTLVADPPARARAVRSRRALRGAADHRRRYVPALRELCEEHNVRAVLPLTDLDIEVLAHARERSSCPRSCPPPR